MTIKFSKEEEGFSSQDAHIAYKRLVDYHLHFLKLQSKVKDPIDDARMKMEMSIECFAKALYESHSPESATPLSRLGGSLKILR